MNKWTDPLLKLSPHIEAMRQELANLAAAPNKAPRSLPGRFYVNDDYFNYECMSVLRGGWHCVGRVDEVPNIGDYFTLQLFNEPIIIVHDTSGIKALSNVCRHRGMQLAQGKGTAKSFVCSYHAWSYATDGALLRAARMRNEGFDPKTCKLGTFHCVTKLGFIYICLAPNPPDLESDLEGLDAVIAPFEPENYNIVYTATEVWQTNWKCLVENFMEGYHLSVVHPKTLHHYTPTGLSRKAVSGEGFTSYFAHYPEKAPSRGKGADGLTPEQRHRSTLFSVFPCQVVSVAATLLVSLSIRPKTAGSIEVKWTMSVYGDELDEETIRERIALWKEVNREDREKLEKMQKCLGSIFATGGPLAEPDYEGTVHDVLLWLAKQDAARQNSQGS